MKYIPADKLIAEIERRKKQDVTFRERSILIDMENAITFLQQEEPELDIDTLRDWSMRYAPDIRPGIEATAYHFWNMALNARK